MAWLKLRESLCRLPPMIARGRFDFTFDGIPMDARDLSGRKRANLVLAGLDALVRPSRLVSTPPAIQIEPTNRCQLHCPLCPTGTDTLQRPSGHMSPETFTRIMDDLGGTLISTILYGWGEPFLNPHMTTFIGECSRRRILTVTSTNGQCLQNSDEADAVVESGLSALVFAVDGASQKSYQQYRRDGQFGRALTCIRNIETAKRRQRRVTPFTNLRVVLTRDNRDELEDLRSLAERLGVNMFSYKSLGCLTDAPAYTEFESVAPEDARFAKRRETYGPVRCPVAFRQPTVFWDGTVVGCEFDYDLEEPLGNLHDVSFRELWNGTAARRLRKRLHRRRERSSFCKRCPYHSHAQERTVLHHETLHSREAMG